MRAQKTRSTQMTTRLERIGEFSQGAPPAGEALELLCEDSSGTYLIPSLCIWREGKWVTAELRHDNSGTGRGLAPTPGI